MRLLSTGVAELAGNVRWLMEQRVQVLGEVVLETPSPGSTGPSEEDATERLRSAMLRRDNEAEDKATIDLIRAQVRQWWADFPERQLLAELYRRAARRREGTGSNDSRRRPTPPEGVCVARALLADVQDTKHLDLESESMAVTEALVRHWMHPSDECAVCSLEDYIERSESSRAHFDAVWCITGLLLDHGGDVSETLIGWLEDVHDRRRLRPPLASVPSHRPVNPATLVRDAQIHFTLEILRGVGVSPRGDTVSGCRMVAEALGLSEDSVARIWKERAWEKSFESVLRKHLGAVHERTGLHYDADV